MSEIISTNTTNTVNERETCFICFEEKQENAEENILTMSGCGCREYVHPTCIGQWIETHYENYIPMLETQNQTQREEEQSQILCPICNTPGIIISPKPILTKSEAIITIQRFFMRFQRNQTHQFNQLLLINPLNPIHQVNERNQIDMKRFLVITCSMLSIIFILLWILFIFNFSPK